MTPSGRRNFLAGMGKVGLGAVMAALGQPAWSRELEKNLQRFAGQQATELAGEEDFWYAIQQAYTVSPTLINLNNGGISPSPRVVQEVLE